MLHKAKATAWEHRSKTQHLAVPSTGAPAEAGVAPTQREWAAGSGIFGSEHSLIGTSFGTNWLLESGSKVLIPWSSHCWLHPHGHSVLCLDASLWCGNQALPRDVTPGGIQTTQCTPSWAQHRWHCGKQRKSISLLLCYLCIWEAPGNPGRHWRGSGTEDGQNPVAQEVTLIAPQRLCKINVLN